MGSMTDPQFFARGLRKAIMTFHNSLAREQALIKLAECEMWLSEAKPKQEPHAPEE